MFKKSKIKNVFFSIFDNKPRFQVASPDEQYLLVELDELYFAHEQLPI